MFIYFSLGVENQEYYVVDQLTDKRCVSCLGSLAVARPLQNYCCRIMLILIRALLSPAAGEISRSSK